MPRRPRPRWLAALLSGLVLPLDPVLGLALLTITLFRPRKAPVAPSPTGPRSL